ncbi:MAG: putative tyrosine--tRNA ligase, mitochondrial [Parachlamydiales bacterium]|nr:putative tyrosine--tRNA ligase, mitochondrial [Parachlamydiales bacterium]
MKNVIECLQERGFIEQMTSPELVEHTKQPRNVYLGFDPTADSLHLGNLVAIIALEWFRRFGHQPVVILGGATARIGDPGGKSQERPLLDDSQIEHNLRSIRHFFEHIFYGPGLMPVVLNNNDWYRDWRLIDFLRDVGKTFRISQMLAKESVKMRLGSEEGLSFTEFSYQILQGYDFAYLNQHRQVTIQMGGSDQWGNITAGIEYNRKIGQSAVYGLTFPLLTRSDGKKFGKSEEGAVWLSEEKLSAYHFYQYLVRVPDADVIKLLRMLTFLPMNEIRAIESDMQKSDYVPNSAQKRLAEEVTRFVHLEHGLQTALKVTDGMAPGSDAQLDAQTLQLLMRDMPHEEMSRSDVVDCKAVDLLVRVNLASSKSEAVRLIKNGGAYLNNVRIEDPAFAISSRDLIDGAYLLLSAGKKKRFLVHIAK